MEKLTNRTQSGGGLRSLGKVLALMIFVVFLTFTFAGALKWFGINGGPLTRIIPFLAMLIGVLVFLKLIDRQPFSDIGLQHFRRVWDYSVIATGLSLLPLMWDMAATYTDYYSNPIICVVFLLVALAVLGLVARFKKYNQAKRGGIEA